MAYDKRNAHQLEFDLAKHGWAFCNKPMLAQKIDRLDAIAQCLDPTDKRHEILRTIKLVYDGKEGEK